VDVEGPLGEQVLDRAAFRLAEPVGPILSPGYANSTASSRAHSFGPCESRY
jgi:hypothetical protein